MNKDNIVDFPVQNKKVKEQNCIIVIPSFFDKIISKERIMLLRKSQTAKKHAGKWCLPNSVYEGDENEALSNILLSQTGLKRSGAFRGCLLKKYLIKKPSKIYRINSYVEEFSFPQLIDLPTIYSDVRFFQKEEVSDLDLAGQLTEQVIKDYVEFKSD